MNFLDDLDQLNKNQDDGFSGINRDIYDKYNYILSQDRNPEFFEGLCKMCKDSFPKLPSNKNGFTQEDLDKIENIYCNSKSYFKNVTSLDELQYFHNLEKIYSWSFYNCRDLKSIIFPENLKKIKNNSFFNCISLEKVIFPENIKFGFTAPKMVIDKTLYLAEADCGEEVVLGQPRKIVQEGVKVTFKK